MTHTSPGPPDNTANTEPPRRAALWRCRAPAELIGRDAGTQISLRCLGGGLGWRGVNDPLGAMKGNMRAFYRLLGERSPGGSVVERDGLLAAIVPSCPNQSIVNAVVYEDGAVLRAKRNELEAAYARAGVRCWRVWVPDADSAIGEWLQSCGHEPSGSPRAMTLDLVNRELDVSDELECDSTGDVAALASINEQAYGLPTGEFTQALTAFAADSVEVYLAYEHGQAAACVAAVDADRDCGIYAVATRPASRGRGLASALMRRALTDALRRGCNTSSLQSSRSGFSVYERLGYRDLGAIHTWEHRSSNRPH
jgi:GNAT superfamily N-acetyltransferase